MKLSRHLTPRVLLTYVLGIFLLSLGTAASVRSGLGSGPAVSVCFTVTLITGANFGLTTFLWQCFLLLLQFLILRKDFRLSMVFQLIAGFLFGYFNNIGLLIIDLFPTPEHLLHKLFYIVIAFTVGGLGVWLYTSAGLVNMPTEGIVKAIADKSGREFHVIKVCFDVACVAGSGIACLLRLHSLGSVGIGTVIIAFMFGTMVGFYKKHFHHYLEGFLKQKAAI